jgi:hypothetical protein
MARFFEGETWMNENENESPVDEQARLRAELRELEDRIQSRLRNGAHARISEIEADEKVVRAIVLRLVAIEREMIEREIADAL